MARINAYRFGVPVFMFIMGVSTFFAAEIRFSSHQGMCFENCSPNSTDFLIGLVLNWFGSFCHGLTSGENIEVAAVAHFDTLRILGVLQRLALAYGFAALAAVLFDHKS